ncbi:MAG: protein-glutamate O-methyltransferase CheR [Thermoleophilaceae bacterium]|nr:protein-glutamate O-methyltransferase CheR [Thermoleophilaceae bacterium]
MSDPIKKPDRPRVPIPPAPTRAPINSRVPGAGLPLPAPEPLKPLPPGDFENFCKGVKDLLGVDLSLYKRKQMERRARGLASRNHAETLTEYLHMLQKDAILLDRFMERMTITVSQLWRNTDIFDAIEQEILPELDARADGRKLKLWSAGCSYGAEPHTLAAICLEMGNKLSRTPQIKGTDINPRMIERARRGHFSEEDARDAPPRLLQKYFDKVPGGWVAKPSIKQLLTFKVEDLFASKTDAVDLILFRNVAIHFERERRDQVHEILARALMPGGILVLGSTEMIVNPSAIGLERVRPFVFRKVDQEAF